MKIQVTQTLPNGQITQQVLSKDGAEVLKIQAQPGAKLSFNVEAGKPAGTVATKPKTGDIKKIGNNLVLESEGEALVEVSDFYSNAGASVGDVGWNYAATNVAATEATPEAQAMAADTAVAGSGALLPVIAPGWLVAGGVAAIAAGSSGGGGSNTSTSTPPNEGGGTSNNPPTAVNLTNAVASVAEVANNVATSARIKVADINVVDADGGTNTPYTVSNSAYFEADATGLYIKAGVVLDHETLKTLSTTVTANGVTSSAISVAVTDVNDAPTLTTVSTLTGFAKGAYKEISYADLAAAGNEADPENSALSFRVETVSTGTLQKWNATTSAWDSVMAGSTLVAAGEKLQWKAADGSSGTALNAFTIKAWDGALASAEAVQVKADVAASSSGGGGGGGAAGNSVSGVVTGGPLVAGHGLTVSLYKADGSLIKAGVALTVGANGGTYTQDLGSYSGAVVVKVVDASAGSDYIDEASGGNKDLNATLMAVSMTNGSSITVNVNAVTTVAAKKMGLNDTTDGSDVSLASLVTPNKVTDANSAVAAALGLAADLPGTTPDVTTDGSLDVGSAAGKLGALLAVLSGVDANNAGNSQTTIDNLASAITQSGASGALTEAGQATLMAGAIRADAATTGGVLVDALSTILATVYSSAAITISEITADNVLLNSEGINGAALAIGYQLSGTCTAGSVVVLSLNGTTPSGAVTVTGTTWNCTITGAEVTALGADGAKYIKATGTVGGVSQTATRTFELNAVDHAPSGVVFTSLVAGMLENTTSAETKVATVKVADDGLGTATLNGALGGADAALFRLGTVTNGMADLFFNSGTSLDRENQAIYSVTVSATGSGLGTPGSGTFVLNVDDINEAPTAANATFTINEETSKVFAAADFGFSDAADSVSPYALAAVIITTLPTVGSLKLNGVTVTAGQSIAVADITAGHLVFTPVANANGTGYATIGFKVQDNGGTANGGVDTSTTANTLTIDVTALNDAPVNTVPTAKTVNEDTDLAVTGLSVADVDAGSSNITVTLSVTHGTITVASNIAGGLASGGIATNGTASVVLTGTVAAINATLAGTNGVVYKGALNYNGSDTLTMLTSDGGNTGTGGTLSDSDTVAITVTAVNDTPTSTALGNGIELPAATFGTAFPSYDAKTALAIMDVEDASTLVYSLVGAPTWLSINSSGAISGTAPALGSTGAPAAGDLITFQVKATDSGGLFTQQTVSLHIYNSPQVLSIARATMANVDSNGNTAATGDIDFTIIFNKTDVIGATANDFTVSFTPTGGSATNLTALTDFTLTQGVDAAHYTLKVLAAKVGTLLDGTLAVTAVGGDIHDTANNPVNSILPTGASNQTYVLDHVNQAPTFASSTATATAINEGTAASTVIFTAAATDPDLTAPNKTLIYSIGGTDVSKFDINTSTGAVSLKPAYTYDFETKPSYSFTVTATDSGTGALNATQTVSLAINNVNEAPTLVVSPPVGYDTITLARSVASPASSIASYYTDPDDAAALGGASAMTFELASGSSLPAGVTLNANGTFSVNTSTVAAAGMYTVSLVAKDYGVTGDTASDLSAAHTYTLNLVNAPTLSTTLGSTANAALKLDVTSNIVLTASDTAVTAVDGKTITITDVGGTHFLGENTTNTFVITLDDAGQHTWSLNGGAATVDTSLVAITGGKISINLPKDLDFSSNYTMAIQDGAFLGSTGLATTHFTDISFSTVAPSGAKNVADTAGLSYAMNESTGEMGASYVYMDITGWGAKHSGWAGATAIDLGAAKIALVIPDLRADASYALTDAGTGIGVSDFNLKMTNFSGNDRIYIDDLGRGDTTLSTTASSTKTMLDVIYDVNLVDSADGTPGYWKAQFAQDPVASGAVGGFINIESNNIISGGVFNEADLNNSIGAALTYHPVIYG